MIRERIAPRAVRMDISARRFMPRTRRRLAMLAQAMRSTRPETHIKQVKMRGVLLLHRLDARAAGGEH